MLYFKTMTNQTIMKRRSYRTFSDRPVEEDVERSLLEMTLRAPSGGNMQLWSMIRVRDEEKKRILSQTCDNQPFIAKAPLVYLFLVDSHKWLEYFKASRSAEKFDIPMRMPGIGDFHLGLQDAMAAAQTCVLASETLGLHSCYIGDIIEQWETVQKTFSLPDYAVPACMLVLGYPKEELKAPLLPRPEVDDFFFTDSYPELTGEMLEKMYSRQEAFQRERGTLPFDNQGSYADSYYKRKYMSDFMKEMNRSARAFLGPWLKGEGENQ